MAIIQIKPQWFRLDSNSDDGRLTWFGRSRGEVMGKFKAWVRQQDLRRYR